MRKKKKLEFVPYDDNKYYNDDVNYYYGMEKYCNPDNEISSWNIDEKYKQYEKIYLTTMLNKRSYEKIINELIRLQNLGRRMTMEEARYAAELWRAIEPKDPKKYINDTKYVSRKITRTIM